MQHFKANDTLTGEPPQVMFRFENQAEAVRTRGRDPEATFDALGAIMGARTGRWHIAF